MVSPQTELQLVQLLKAIAEEESQIEDARQELAEIETFEPFTVFKSIDTKSLDYISIPQLYDFLRQSNIEIYIKDIESFFRSCSSKGDGRLVYYDFLGLILPKCSSTLRRLVVEREAYYTKKNFQIPFEVRFGVANIFDKLIKAFRKIEYLRHELVVIHAVNQLAAYDLITQGKPDSFDYINLTNFLHKNGAICSEKEVVALLKYADKNKDGKLSYIEFVELITPITPYEPITQVPDIQHENKAMSERKSRHSTPKKRPSQVGTDLSDMFSASLEKLKKYERLADSISRAIFSRSKSRSPRRSANGKVQSREASPRRSESARGRSPLRVSALRGEEEPSPRISSARITSSSPLRETLENGKIHRRALSVKVPERISQRDSARSSKTPERVEKDDRETFMPRRTPEKSERPSVNPLRNTMDSFQERSSIRSGIVIKNRNIVNILQRTETAESVLIASPVKKREEFEVVNILKRQLDLEREIENAKKNLALKSDFNLFEAFRFFDADESEYITRSQLQSGLEALEIFPTKEQLYHITKKLDGDNDGLIHFSDLRDLLTPKDDSTLYSLKRMPPYQVPENPGKTFRPGTMDAFKKALDIIITNEVELEKLRGQLSPQDLTSSFDAFKVLDRNQDGQITLDEMEGLFKDSGISASHKELINLFNKYDKDQDGRISYSDFIQGTVPKSSRKL